MMMTKHARILLILLFGTAFTLAPSLRSPTDEYLTSASFESLISLKALYAIW